MKRPLSRWAKASKRKYLCISCEKVLKKWWKLLPMAKTAGKCINSQAYFPEQLLETTFYSSQGNRRERCKKVIGGLKLDYYPSMHTSPALSHNLHDTSLMLCIVILVLRYLICWSLQICTKTSMSQLYPTPNQKPQNFSAFVDLTFVSYMVT